MSKVHSALDDEEQYHADERYKTMDYLMYVMIIFSVLFLG